MPVYRTPKVEDAQKEAKAASLEDKERAWKVYDNLVKKEEELLAGRRMLFEKLPGMHLPMHVVLMIIYQSSCVYNLSSSMCRAPCKSPLISMRCP